MSKTKVQLQAELAELEEKLKALDETNKALQRQFWKSAQADALLRQMLQKCKECGRLLRLIDWNEKVYIMVCDYSGCRAYRNQVANINKEVIRGFLEVEDGITSSRVDS